MSDNDWYEKGERPPVGEVVLIDDRSFDPTGWIECEILYMGENTVTYRTDKLNDEICYLCDCEFKPLKSKQDQEREAFVKELKHDVYLYAINTSDQISMKQSTGEHLAELVLNYLFDKGYRKVKPLNYERFANAVNAENTGYTFKWLLENNHIVSESE